MSERRDVTVEVGYQVFTEEGGEEVGAVRAVRPHELQVYLENAGDFTIPGAAVVRVHDGKVIVDEARLGPELRRAIAHAHDREDPRL